MLDYQLSMSVSDHAWNTSTARATLAQSDEEFFAESGAGAQAEDSRRRYRRIRARGRAIAVRGTERYGVFTDDVSPFGIGFFSPIQLFPKEQVTLYFEESDKVVLEVRRCVRTEQNSYSCGGNFLKGPMSPSAYRNFLAELKS